MATGSRSGKRTPQIRVNQRITAKIVRLVDEDNEQVGIVDLEEGLKQATDAGLDLVEVSPNSDPPVCRIMDYGQYKYKQSKRLHEAKKHQKIIHLKEIKMRPKTEEHDFQFKLRHALEFFSGGDKVKVSIMFRGRELSHQELGLRLLEKFAESAADIAMIESPVKLEGRNLSMVMAPIKKQGKK